MFSHAPIWWMRLSLYVEVWLLVIDVAAAAAAAVVVVCIVVVVHVMNGRSTKTTGKLLRAVCVGTVLLCARCCCWFTRGKYLCLLRLAFLQSVQKSQSAVFEISCR